MKKFMALLSAVAVLLSATACSQQSSEASGTPDNSAASGTVSAGQSSLEDGRLTDEPVTLEIMNAINQYNNDYNDVEIWKRYAEKTGITINWISVPDSGLEERRNLALASGDLPDAFYRCGLGNTDLLSYGSDGTFIPLNDLIDQYAPNFKAMADEDSSIIKGVTQADGNIYSLPFLCDFLSANFSGKIFYNNKWMESAEQSVPQDLDEFVDLLTNFKNDNPAGTDMVIPLDATGIDSVLSYFYGAFGLQNRGVANSNLDCDPDTGDVRFIPTTDDYKKMLEFIHTLYSEQLLNPDIFTTDMAKMTANIQNEMTCAFLFTNPIPAGSLESDYVPGEVMKGPDGYQMASAINSIMRSPGAFAITKVNKYPELTMQWVDYWYSDEGILEYYMGWEGETYTVENGEYTYIDEINNNPDGLTLDAAVAPYLCWPGAGQPTKQTQKYSKGGAARPAAIEATEMAEPYFPEEIWSPFTYTMDENDRLISLQTDINARVKEARTEFITNGVDDAAWESYKADLETMGFDDYMDIQNAAYQRYKS